MLEWIELFSSLWSGEISTLEMFCQSRQIKAWEVLFEKWDESTSMYIVKEGLLEAYITNKVLWNIKVWEFVWEMAIFNEPKLRTASVRAVENSEVIILLSFSIQQLAKTNPEIVQKIQNVIAQRNEENGNN